MAAIAHMNDTNKHRFYLLTTGDVHKDFPTSPASEAGEMDYVIIGDAGERLTYGNMNRAFRYLMNGAELLAPEKDRYWMEKDGLSLSAGPFVAGLEFATGKRATVM